MGHPQQPYCLQQPQGADSIGIGGIFGGVERHLDVRHGRQVIDFVGLYLLDDFGEVQRVGHVAVVEDEALAVHMGVLVEVVDAFGVERRGAAFDAVHEVSFFEQELGQIGSVLTGNPGNQRNFCHTSGYCIPFGQRVPSVKSILTI